MGTTMDFDDTAARRIEAVYRTPDVVATRVEVLRALELRPRERVLDLGTGPGFLAYDMAATVGSSGQVAGVDISEAMLGMARRRCAAQPWAEFHDADVTRLPFADCAFDAAVSTQVYEYVPDIARALAELQRVIRPGGRVVILDTDFGSFVCHSLDAARTRRILAAYDQHVADPHLPRTLTPKLRAAGLEVARREVLPLFNAEGHANAYGPGLIDFIRAFVIGRDGITAEEADAWVAELHELAAKGEFFFSLNRYLFVARKPEV